MIRTFDASALIAFLRNEPGSEVAGQYLNADDSQSFAHAINLCEVYYDFYRASGQASAEEALRDLVMLGVVERNDFDPAFWRDMGYLKAVYRRVSLADCCALALTRRLGGVLVSTDRHELEPLAIQGVCRITFIR